MATLGTQHLNWCSGMQGSEFCEPVRNPSWRETQLGARWSLLALLCSALTGGPMACCFPHFPAPCPTACAGSHPAEGQGLQRSGNAPWPLPPPGPWASRLQRAAWPPGGSSSPHTSVALGLALSPSRALAGRRYVGSQAWELCPLSSSFPTHPCGLRENARNSP